MTVTAKGNPPNPRTVLHALDAEAKAAMRAARDAVKPIVTANTPRKSGQVQRALTPAVRQNRNGQSLTIAPPRGKRHSPGDATIADVVRYLTRGTGTRRIGPGPKKPIRAQRRLGRITVYGRARRSVQGQAPQPFMARIDDLAGPRVDRAVREGAARAVRAAAGVRT